MAKLGADQLYERVAFERSVPTSDGGGGTIDTWQEQFQCRAAYIHLRGGESVMAGRLAGKHTQIIRVRASSETRQVSTEWRVSDARTGDLFNVRDITPSADRMWLDFLCEKGVAT